MKLLLFELVLIVDLMLVHLYFGKMVYQLILLGLLLLNPGDYIREVSFKCVFLFSPFSLIRTATGYLQPVWRLPCFQWLQARSNNLRLLNALLVSIAVTVTLRLKKWIPH